MTPVALSHPIGMTPMADQRRSGETPRSYSVGTQAAFASTNHGNQAAANLYK